MNFIKNNLNKLFILSIFFIIGNAEAQANNRCSTQLFSATLNSSLTIGDVVENLADECQLTLLVKDKEAKKRLRDKLYYVKLNDASLNEFLDTVLVENDINYELDGNKLKISYLTTKTFKLDYISGDRTGKSNAHVTIANSGSAGSTTTTTGGTGGGTDGTSGSLSLIHI